MKRTPAHRSATFAAVTKTALRISSLLAIGLLLSACKPTAKVALDVDPSGLCALVSVNGNPLPSRIAPGGNQIEVRAGMFTLQTNGLCATKTIFVPPSGGEVMREANADDKRNGSQLTMRWKGAGITTGTLEGNTFTMNNEGMVLVYRK